MKHTTTLYGSYLQCLRRTIHHTIKKTAHRRTPIHSSARHFNYNATKYAANKKKTATTTNVSSQHKTENIQNSQKLKQVKKARCAD